MLDLSKVSKVLSNILQEMQRQQQLKAAGKFRYTAQDAELSYGDKVLILLEEVGEVATAINDGESSQRIYEELIQVAAVAASFASSQIIIMEEPNAEVPKESPKVEEVVL